jgi:hypothetical protein
LKILIGFLLSLFPFFVHAETFPDWSPKVEQESYVSLVLNENQRSFQNTGKFILRDPVYGSVLGEYDFTTGGYGNGSAPFGMYELGRFRNPEKDPNDDPLNIGKRWMISQPNQEDQGDAVDPGIPNVTKPKKRSSLEIHHVHHRVSPGTQGCIAIIGSQDVWKQFVQQMNYIVAQVGRVVFHLGPNPNGTTPSVYVPPYHVVFKKPRHIETGKRHSYHKHRR